MPEPLETAIATVRAYAAAVGPARIVALLDVGHGASAVMIEWTPEAVTVTADGQETVVGPVIAVARELPDLRPIPASSVAVDVASGEIAAPLGAVRHLVEGVSALAVALGGRSVAAVDFQTDDPDVELTLAAREGEPVVAAVGEQLFQLPGE
jgi:hypothetical protein